MKHKKQPRCYIVAGPNGAGKTTFALKYLPRIASCYDFINADEIAKGLSPLDYEAGLLKASKIFLETLNWKIANRNDFAFETTLSGRTYLPRITVAQIGMVRHSFLPVHPQCCFSCPKNPASCSGRRTRHSGRRYCQALSAKHPESVSLCGGLRPYDLLRQYGKPYRFHL